MPNKIQQLLKNSRNSWLILIQATAWIAAVIASFVLPPPIGTAAETKVWVRFAQFVITILIGLFVLVALRWNRKKDVLPWAATAAAFLLLGTICFFTYQILATRWTTAYFGERILLGGTFTQHGAEYHAQNPTLTSSNLLKNYAGQAEKIWTVESINERRFFLAGIYVLAMPLFTICIISLLQAMQCATAEKAPRRRRR